MKKVLLYFLLFSSSFLHAQFYELGLGGSGTLFHGDVGAVGTNAQGVYGFLPNQPVGQITLRRQYNWHWSTRMNYYRGYVGASDAWARDDFKLNRGIAFRTEISEFSYMTEFNFWPYGTGTKFKRSFYIFGGLGLTFYNPQGFYQDEWHNLRELGTEGQQTELSDQLFYGNTTLTVPFGMGYRQSLGRDFSLSAEIGWRRYGTDYMDDTSGDYVDAVALEEERNAVAAYFSNPGNVSYSNGLARGTAEQRDWTIFAGLTIFYNLSPRDERCSGF